MGAPAGEASGKKRLNQRGGDKFRPKSYVSSRGVVNRNRLSVCERSSVSLYVSLSPLVRANVEQTYFSAAMLAQCVCECILLAEPLLWRLLRRQQVWGSSRRHDEQSNKGNQFARFILAEKRLWRLPEQRRHPPFPHISHYAAQMMHPSKGIHKNQ